MADNFTPLKTNIKKKSNRFLIFANIFLLLFIVLITGYYFKDTLISYIPRAEKEEEEERKKTPTPQPPTQVPEPTVTSGPEPTQEAEPTTTTAPEPTTTLVPEPTATEVPELTVTEKPADDEKEPTRTPTEPAIGGAKPTATSAPEPTSTPDNSSNSNSNNNSNIASNPTLTSAPASASSEDTQVASLPKTGKLATFAILIPIGIIILGLLL